MATSIVIADTNISFNSGSPIGQSSYIWCSWSRKCRKDSACRTEADFIPTSPDTRSETQIASKSSPGIGVVAADGSWSLLLCLQTSTMHQIRWYYYPGRALTSQFRFTQIPVMAWWPTSGVSYLLHVVLTATKSFFHLRYQWSQHVFQFPYGALYVRNCYTPDH